MPRQRLGVALLIPAPVDAEVDTLRRAVGADDIDRLPPHLTLVPPVNVRDEDMDAALELLRDAASVTKPFRVTLGPPRTFLPINPVLFLEVGGDVAAVDALRDRIFRPPLERTLTWPFQPHVTLLENDEPERITNAVDVLAGYRTEVVFERLHLLREERRDEDGERVWRPIADAAFGERGVVGRGGLELELEVTDKPPLDAKTWADRTWKEYELGRYGAEWEGRHLHVTARRDGKVVGIADGEVRDDTGEAYLDSLMVGADVRGEGIGAQLIAAFSSAAAERGATYVSLQTEDGGDGIGFYERLGFRRVYELPEFRFGRAYLHVRREL
jgi:2'-5' RNA ligase/ribosomal protein S18 acetylase RimI-like enzyme